eukprot:scaffold2526_cov131-Cylindrotheca_fusiformis.AAC.3
MAETESESEANTSLAARRDVAPQLVEDSKLDNGELVNEVSLTVEEGISTPIQEGDKESTENEDASGDVGTLSISNNLDNGELFEEVSIAAEEGQSTPNQEEDKASKENVDADGDVGTLSISDKLGNGELVSEDCTTAEEGQSMPKKEEKESKENEDANGDARTFSISDKLDNGELVSEVSIAAEEGQSTTIQEEYKDSNENEVANGDVGTLSISDKLDNGELVSEVSIAAEEGQSTPIQEEYMESKENEDANGDVGTLSIGDLERQLHKENLKPEDRKKLRAKLKQKRQKERRRTGLSERTQDGGAVARDPQISEAKKGIADQNAFNFAGAEDAIHSRVKQQTSKDPRKSGTDDPLLSPAQRAKNQELEALRNLGLAGRKRKALKKSINKNLSLQQRQPGNMEWRPVGEASSPESIPATSPSMAYEQLAMKQQKDRAEQREKKRETMMQYQQHPESLGKDSKYKFEMDFVFGLVVAKGDPAPDKYASTKAAAKIVPSMIASKKTIYYDPRYPPKVSKVERDPDFDKPGRVRYMVKGKIPVLPRKGSPKSATPEGSMVPSASSSLKAVDKGSQSKTDQSMKESKKQLASNPELAENKCSLEHEPLQERSGDDCSKKNDSGLQVVSTTEMSVEEAPELTGMLQWDGENQQKTTQTVGTNHGTGLALIAAVSADMEREGMESGDNDPLTICTRRDAQSSTLEPAFSSLSYDENSSPEASRPSEVQFDIARSSEGEDPGEQSGHMANEELPKLEELCELEKAQQESKKSGGGSRKSETTDTSRLFQPEQFEETAAGSEKGVRSRPSRKKVQNIRTSKNLELEALRQKGIARKKNLDFKKFEEQSARDRAASKAAKEDLERRKSSTSEYKFSASGIVNPHDLLFLEQNKQRRADRKKQQETMLEYHGGVTTPISQPPSATLDTEISRIPSDPTCSVADRQRGYELLFQHPPGTGTEESTSTEGTSAAGQRVALQQDCAKSQSSRTSQNAQNSPVRQNAIQADSPPVPKRVSKSRESLELLALREQGLAKKGSQQFAKFEEQSQESKILHDAATRDLEERRSKKSEYTYSGSKEISPIDALYLDHHKWKKETVKKDREAMGIYDKTPAHLVNLEEGEHSKPQFMTTDGYNKRESSGPLVGDVPKIGSGEDKVVLMYSIRKATLRLESDFCRRRRLLQQVFAAERHLGICLSRELGWSFIEDVVEGCIGQRSYKHVFPYINNL